jgi:hypothetical protein
MRRVALAAVLALLADAAPTTALLADHSGLEVTLIGGTLRRNALVTVGACASFTATGCTIRRLSSSS